MSMLLKLLILGVLILVGISCANSNSCNNVDFPTSGCEFFFNIPYIHRPTTPALILVTTSSIDTVTVHLTIPAMEVEVNSTYTISRYQHVEIPIPPVIRLNHGDGVQNKTIVVTSSDVVSVYAMDNEISKGEGFLVLPTSRLGTKYYVASYIPDIHTSFYCISAFDEETVVDITSESEGEQRIVLQAFQSYRYDGGEGEDLTSTVVQSNKPITVVSGGTSSIPVGASYIDGLVEQVPPVSGWGQEHYLAPFLGRVSGFVYRVISSTENTILTISDIGTVVLPANGFYEGSVTEEVIVVVASDEPVLVVQYMKSAYADPGNTKRGDPSMVVVPPRKSYVNSVSFPIMDTFFPFEYYITVIANCNDIDGLLFDDITNIVDWNLIRSGNDSGSMCSIRGRIQRGSGVHSVVHRDPTRRFSVMMYAISARCCTSYSYIAGAGFPYVPTVTSVATVSMFSETPFISTTERSIDTTSSGVTGTATPTIPSIIDVDTDNTLVIRLITIICSLLLILILMAVFIVILIKRIKKSKKDFKQQATTNGHSGPDLQSKHLPSGEPTLTLSPGSINQVRSISGSSPVSLSADGYVRYNGNASEDSYQGLYSSATVVPSGNESGSVPLTADGYVRYDGNASEKSYQGLYSSTIAPSTNGSGQVSLSADGYVRYDGTASENSYQGLYSTATIASSTNDAYEGIPE